MTRSSSVVRCSDYFFTKNTLTVVCLSRGHTDSPKHCLGEDKRGMIRPAERKWWCRNTDTRGSLARQHSLWPFTLGHLPIKYIYLLSVKSASFVCVFVYASICLCMPPFVCVFVYASICLCVCICLHLFVCLRMPPFVCVFVYASICLEKKKDIVAAACCFTHSWYSMGSGVGASP